MTALEEFAPGAARKPGRKGKPSWTPMAREGLAKARLLCFDPSLSATGFVALEHGTAGLLVHTARTLRGDAPQDLTGWEQIYAQADDLGDQVVELLAAYPSTWDVVVEQPPMGGGQIRSPESAILAGAAIRWAARQTGHARTPLMASQTHKWATTGSRTVKKTEHHALLRTLLHTLELGRLHLITNESQRDAVSVGLAELRRRGA